MPVGNRTRLPNGVKLYLFSSNTRTGVYRYIIDNTINNNVNTNWHPYGTPYWIASFCVWSPFNWFKRICAAAILRSTFTYAVYSWRIGIFSNSFFNLAISLRSRRCSDVSRVRKLTTYENNWKVNKMLDSINRFGFCFKTILCGDFIHIYRFR